MLSNLPSVLVFLFSDPPASVHNQAEKHKLERFGKQVPPSSFSGKRNRSAVHGCWRAIDSRGPVACWGPIVLVGRLSGLLGPLGNLGPSSVWPQCMRLSHKSVSLHECPARVSRKNTAYKSVLQDHPTRVSNNVWPLDFECVCVCAQSG